MKNAISASISIDAAPEKVWDVLVNPEKIRELLGSEVETDWKPGSAIAWKGEFNGHPYENKGVVVENLENRVLRHTYWSGFGGDAESPENYSEVAYRIEPGGGKTLLTYSRTAIPTEAEKQAFEQHLPYMLEQVKKMAESQ